MRPGNTVAAVAAAETPHGGQPLSLAWQHQDRSSAPRALPMGPASSRPRGKTALAEWRTMTKRALTCSHMAVSPSSPVDHRTGSVEV